MHSDSETHWLINYDDHSYYYLNIKQLVIFVKTDDFLSKQLYFFISIYLLKPPKRK